MTESKKTIFDYMDIYLFLNEYYRIQKSLSLKFSYTVWSHQIGFKNKTILRLILQKKRTLTANSSDLFKKYFQFNELELQYFEALAAYSQAKTTSQKQAYGSLLIKIQRQNFKQTTMNPDAGLLYDVYSPIILTILSSSDTPLKFEEIQNYSGIESSRLNGILQKLIEMNFAKTDYKFYTSVNDTFKVPDNFLNKNLKSYYEFWIEQSKKMIELPFELRRFRSLQIALTTEEFNDIVLQINEFANLLLSKVQNNQIQNRSVYLLNTSLFPVNADFI